jgi:hypothetical protein
MTEKRKLSEKEFNALASALYDALKLCSRGVPPEAAFTVAALLEDVNPIALVKFAQSVPQDKLQELMRETGLMPAEAKLDTSEADPWLSKPVGHTMH